jgi:hypothetical protein
MEKIIMNNQILSLSESDDGLTLKAKFLICPLDESNLNGVGLKDEDLTDTEKSGLKNQPIVAKIIKNSDGELDFSGHNLKKVYEKNDDTKKMEAKYVFDTYPIGVHEKSYVEDLDLNGENKKCIVADCLFWTRYENSIKVLKRLYDEQNLHSSWEISYGESYIENNTKWLKQILWLGNCVLGSNINPAYPIAGALEVSELSEGEKELIEAFTEDVINEQSNNQIITSSEDNKINNNQGGIADMSKAAQGLASVSMNDLYEKVRKAINSIDSRKWYQIPFIFPMEFRAIGYEWDRESDQDFVQFTYVVNSDETISITAQEEVKMVFELKTTIDNQLTEKDTKIAELEKNVETIQSQLSEKETEISTKIETINKLGEEISTKDNVISEKDSVISELLPLKEEKERLESEAKEKELAEKREELKSFAMKGGFITLELIEQSEELKKAIEELDEKTIKVIRAEKIAEKYDSEAKTEEKVETSNANNSDSASANLNNTEEGTLSATDIIKSLLKRK